MYERKEIKMKLEMQWDLLFGNNRQYDGVTLFFSVLLLLLIETKGSRRKAANVCIFFIAFFFVLLFFFVISFIIRILFLFNRMYTQC